MIAEDRRSDNEPAVLRSSTPHNEAHPVVIGFIEAVEHVGRNLE